MIELDLAKSPRGIVNPRRKSDNSMGSNSLRVYLQVGPESRQAGHGRTCWYVELARVSTRSRSALLIAVAGAADSFLLGAAWGTCLDIAGPHAGLVTAVMNTAGQIGAFLSPIVLAYLLKDTSRAEDWALPLFIAGGLYLAGAICWLAIDPARPIVAAICDSGALNGPKSCSE